MAENTERVQIDIDLDAQKLSQGVQESISRIEALEKAMQDLGKTGQQSGETIINKNKDIIKGFDALAKAGKVMTTAVTLPLLGFATASVKTASDFERAMSEVQSISGATGRDLEKLTDYARELGSTTEMSATQASEGMKYFALAGYDVNQILTVMKPTLDLAVASGMDLATACDIISDNVSALGLKVHQTTELVDKMAMTSASSNTTIEMMGEAFKYVAPVANTLGIDVTDLSTAIGILGDNGIKSSQAGTVLRAGLTRLVKPTKQVQDAMDKYGISVQKDVEGNVELMKTVQHVRDKLKGLTKSQKAQAIAQLFGTEAMSGWASMINTSQDRIDELSYAIENSNGKASEMAEIMGDNLKGSINSLKSAFEGMMITVGDMFIPIVRKVVDSITGAIQKFNEMDSGAQKLIVAFGATVASIGPLITVIGGVGGAIMKVIPVMSSLASGMGLTLSASTALIGGLTGLGVAFVGLLGYMGSNSEMIGYLQEKFGAFGTFFSGLGEVIYGTAQLTFGNLGILISTLGNMLMALMKGDFKEVGNIWKDGWAKMEVNTKEAVSNLSAETTGAVKKMREMSASELQKVSNDFDTCMNLAKQVTADNVDEMARAFTDGVSGMTNDSLDILRGSSDTFAVLLSGITEGLTEQQKMNIFTNNLEAMTRSGALTLQSMDKDFKNFNNMIEQNLSTGATRIGNASESVWENFKNVSTRGIESVSMSIANEIQNMDSATFETLSSMGGSWSQVFQGITDTTSMSTEEMANIIKTNYESMGMSSEQIMTAMEQDMQLYVASQQLANTTLTESNQQMANGVIDIYNTLSTVTSDNVSQIADTVINTMDGMAIGSVEKLQGMGQGYAQIFAGIKDDGSMSSQQMKDTVVQNLTAMMEQGLPIGELLKTGMIGFMEDMAVNGASKAGELNTGVSTAIQGTSEAINLEMANIPTDVSTSLAEAGAVAQQGAVQIKDGITTGLTGTSEAVSTAIDINSSVVTEINNATASAQGSSAIKDTIVANTAGATEGVSANMAGLTSAVANATSQATNIANVNTRGIPNVVASNTSSAVSIASANMSGFANVVGSQTANASNLAGQNAKKINTNISNELKNVSKSATTEMNSLKKTIINSMTSTSTGAKQQATNMYNGVKTSFASMQQQGSSSANTLKDNVINATAIMKNSAIKFWNQIRSEYSKTIQGKIEITRTIKENKIVTTVKQDDASTYALDAFAMDEEQARNRELVVASLSRFKDNDTMKLIDEVINKGTKKRTVNIISEDDSNKNATYITNNYSSPKSASLIELKRLARRESRKLGASYR